MSSGRPLTESSVPARERPPRLVLLFAVLTTLGVAAAAAVILVVVRQADAETARRHAADQARLTARTVLVPGLREVDLRLRHPQLDAASSIACCDGASCSTEYKR